jgi:hypothetical protein
MDAVHLPSPASASGQELHSGPIPSLDLLLEQDDLNPREKDQASGRLSGFYALSNWLIGPRLPSSAANEPQCRSFAQKWRWRPGPIPDGRLDNPMYDILDLCGDI